MPPTDMLVRNLERFAFAGLKALLGLATLAAFVLTYLRDPHPDTTAQIEAAREQLMLAILCWIAVLLLWALVVVWSVLRTPASRDRQQLGRWGQVAVGLLPVLLVGLFMLQAWWFPAWKSEQVSRAMSANDPQAMSAFLRQGYRLSPRASSQVMSWAATQGHSEVAAALLDRGVDPNGTYFGEPFLVTAAFSGRAEVVKRLLERGARTETRGRFGLTALETAEEQGHMQVVRLLQRRRQ